MAVQRSSYNLKQLLDRVVGDMGMRGQALVTIEDITRWANQAQSRIARKTHWYRTTETMGTTDGTKTYDWPSRLISVSQVYYDGNPLRLVTERELALWNYDFRNEGTGTPLWFYRLGFNGFGLHATPDTTDVDILTVHGAFLPPAVSDGDDTFYVPAALEEAIECYCNFRAAVKDATGEGRERLALYRQEWKEWEGEIASFVSSAGEGEILVLGSDNAPGGVDVFDPFYNHVVT